MTKSSSTRIQRKGIDARREMLNSRTPEQMDAASVVIVNKLKTLSVSELTLYSIMLSLHHFTTLEFETFFNDTVPFIKQEVVEMQKKVEAAKAAKP